MKRLIESTILSFLANFALFLILNLYTLGDIPTTLVVVRYILISVFGSICLFLFLKFIEKNRKDKSIILSVVSLIPFGVLLVHNIIINFFTNSMSTSNYGAVGLLLYFIFMLLFIPGIVISIIALKMNSNNYDRKITKVLSIIGIILWSLIGIITIRFWII